LLSSLPVRYGVSQGSDLGPLVYILYINDVLHLTQGRIMYPNDTSVLNIWQDIKKLQITTSENIYTSLVE
jgi:hypothetical protein